MAIAIMDESDRQINFNSLKKSATSLPAAIAIMDESDRQINFNSLKKSLTSLPAAIEALSSPLGPHPESDLPIARSASIASTNPSSRSQQRSGH
jgi:hypothetical protein